VNDGFGISCVTSATSGLLCLQTVVGNRVQIPAEVVPRQSAPVRHTPCHWHWRQRSI